MANYCKGYLKVRGKYEDIKRFFEEGFSAWDQESEAMQVKRYTVEEHPQYDCFTIDVSGIPPSIIGFGRNECDFEGVCAEFAVTGKTGLDYLSMFLVECAWRVNAEDLREISKKFNLDLRIHAFECGAEFEQIIEAHKGAIIKNEVVSYRGRDYYWECSNPTWGG